MKISNTFLESLNLDISDLVINNQSIRQAMNIRIIDLDSSTYAVTNIRGTEIAFTLTLGYIPIATKEFDNVIYIVSINPDTSIVELGSFGSPDYYTDDITLQEVYRPLNNLETETTAPTAVDETDPGNWDQKDVGETWVSGHVFLGPTSQVSQILYRDITTLADIPYQVNYVATLDGVSATLSLDTEVVYRFYDSFNNVLYTKTFTGSGIGPINYNVTEGVTFATPAVRVEITATVIGDAAVAVFDAFLFDMTPPTIGELGPFRTGSFGYNEDSFVKIELQPDYDGSINMILIERESPPRIINTKFLRNGLGYLEIAPDRPGTANTNTYTEDGVEEETKLIISTDKILGIALNGVLPGGKVKYGSYRYFFAYMTQDFNSTEIVGQSGLCSVFTGTTMSNLKGGTTLQETDKRVSLSLTNIDTNFKYLKVYALYSSGIDGLQEQMLEFTVPTEITSESMIFYHSGFEAVTEIDQDVVNINFQVIDSAASGTQVNGRLLLAGIRETTIDYSAFREAALEIRCVAVTKELPYTASLSGIEGYADVANIYNYRGLFSGEAYAYAAVFILNGGRLTPPFPVTGLDVPAGNVTNEDGIFRGDTIQSTPFFDGSNIVIKGVEFDISTVPLDIRNQTVGFFIVRAERNPNLITQGYLFPVLRVPPIEFINSNSTYYNHFQLGTESLYKMVPLIDGILEAFEMDTGSGGGDIYVVDDNNKLTYYFPIVINHFGPSSADGQSSDNIAGYINNMPQDHWAYFSADALCNEAYMITQIAQRESMKCQQIAKAAFLVSGQLTPLPTIHNGDTAEIGQYYDVQSFDYYTGPSQPVVKTVDLCEFAPAESFTTGSVFASKISTRFKIENPDAGHAYGVYLNFNSYFGMKVQNLEDITYVATNPQAGNSRIPAPNFIDEQETSGFGYSNYGETVNAGFLVNIYPNGGIDSSNVLISLDSLYPDVDSLIYKQVGARYTWDDAGTSVELYDGDCYVVKCFHKVYQSGYRDPFSPLIRRNIDAGPVVSLFHESRYNANLRNPVRFDNSESEDRSFFPYQSKGDFLNFRRYRYPESTAYNPGYSGDLGPKAFIPVSSLAPVIRNDFFTRISASAEHIPNAFQNGYRNFSGSNFKDYDSSMGRIVDVLNHRGLLVAIFQHGVGVIPISERILTGRDASGPIYALPSSVLPPTMTFPSRKIGCQDPKCIIQTPSAIYALDRDKRKIWQFRDELKAISDLKISSLLESQPIVNPRSGYNFKYNEVIFTTDAWTICYREGIEKFTSPYSFKPLLYASRGGSFYSFNEEGEYFRVHDSPNTNQIDGVVEDCFIEFTVPVTIGEDREPITNVYDYLEIFSNEVPPTKVEFFTYAVETNRDSVLTPSSMGQYCKVENTMNFFKQQPNIIFRDKKYIVQIPPVTQYSSQQDRWRIGGRMRNIYLIVRITYNTELDLQLLSAITTFRVSKS